MLQFVSVLAPVTLWILWARPAIPVRASHATRPVPSVTCTSVTCLLVHPGARVTTCGVILSLANNTVLVCFENPTSAALVNITRRLESRLGPKHLDSENTAGYLLDVDLHRVGR